MATWTTHRRASFVGILGVAVVLFSALPLMPEAGAAGTDLTFGGAVKAVGALTAGGAVCNTPVAASKHVFFFDIKGTTRGGDKVLFSGNVLGYSSPKSYSVNAPYGHILIDVSGRAYASGPTKGTVKVGSGARSALVTISVTNPHVFGLPTGTETVKGELACVHTTNA